MRAGRVADANRENDEHNGSYDTSGGNNSYGSSSDSFTPQSTTSRNEQWTSVDICANFVRHCTKSGTVCIHTHYGFSVCRYGVGFAHPWYTHRWMVPRCAVVDR
jgi:hypothetical protein